MTKGYVVMDTNIIEIFMSRNIVFHEHVFMHTQTSIE